MARLASQQRLGFYPANPLAIAELLKHLRCRPKDPTKRFDSIVAIDPCCGQGAALRQIADGLDIPEENLYTCELDPERGKAVRELIPGGHHVSPASFLGMQITGGSFALAYVNPPFDFELGGKRREEQAFVEKATPLLVHKGVLVLVLPLDALVGNRGFVDMLDSHYEDLRVYRFPDGNDADGKPIRPFNEIVVIGRKRKEAVPIASYDDGKTYFGNMDLRWRNHVPIENFPPLGQVQPLSWNWGKPSFEREHEIRVWEIPHAWRPNTFKKNALTEDELVYELDRSPLNKQVTEVQPLPPRKPPLSLDRGHLGTCAAAGILDGVIEGPHGPHVMRGSSRKERYHNKEQSESTANPETGSVSTKNVWSERPVTEIRAVDATGVIHTWSNAPKEKDEEDEQSLEY